MSDLQQQVWEFVYDLLPEDEAQTMRERISSDPEVARAYSDVMLQSELLGRASRLDIAQVVWTRPGKATSSDELPVPASRDVSGTAWRRTASWLVGVAAAGLLCVMCSPLFVSDSRPETEVADVAARATPPPNNQGIRTRLTGPSKLDPESANTFVVRMTNSDGDPVETDVACRFYDDQDSLAYSDTSRTDASGQWLFELPLVYAKRASRLEIAPTDAQDFLSRPLEVSDAKQVTYLRLDRPLYRPGDAVKYRSVTLSRLALQAAAQTKVRYFVTGPDGDTLEPSVKTESTLDGVGSGEFELPADARDGLYAVVAQSPEASFAEEWREFEVRRYRTPRFKKKLSLAKESYTRGDMVEAEFLAEYAIGGALADAELKAEATFGRRKLAIPETKTDAKGVAKLAFRVPDDVDNDPGSLSVTVRDSDGGETISEEVPINLGKVNVEFYPEGGKLVAGLPNRLYFYCRNSHGKPVHMEGSIAEGANRSIADVATIHEGRGVVSFTPHADVQYYLNIPRQDGAAQSIELPPADAAQQLVMQTGTGVFAAADPIDLKIITKSPETPLVVAGYCRGVMVGQQSVEPSDFDSGKDGLASFAGQLALRPDAEGVIRVTVFDGSVDPVVPIAERLVYRDVRKALQVDLSGQKKSYTPGSSVELEVAVRDERDVPQEAVLGLSVVDETILSLGKDRSTRLPTYFHLLTEIENPQDLEDANFYVSSEEGAEQALDLLLGTQGWRSFVELPPEQLARLDDVHELEYKTSRMSRNMGAPQAAFAEGFDLPFVAEQESVASPVVAQPLVAARPKKRESAGDSQMILLVGGVGLLLLLTVFGTVRVGLSTKVWGPAAGVAAVALILGLISSPSPLGLTAPAVGVSAVQAPAEVQLDADFDTLDVAAVEEAAERADVFAGDVMFDGEEARETVSKDEGLGAEMQQAERLMPAAVASKPGTASPLPDEPAAAAPTQAAESPPPQRGVTAADVELAIRGSSALQAPEQAGGRGRQMERFSLSAPEAPAEATSRTRVVRTESHAAVRRFARTFAYFQADQTLDTAASKEQATIHWQPYLKLGASGNTPVTFELPSRETTYRIIVEAHGSGRLGAAETLITSQREE